MASKNAASEARMGALHDALVTMLTNKIVKGEATAAEMAVAAKLLKDSDITAAIDELNAMGAMRNALERNRAPQDEVDQKTLDDALSDVLDLEAFRNGTR